MFVLSRRVLTLDPALRTNGAIPKRSNRRMRLIADDDCRTRCTGGSKVGGVEIALAYGIRYYW
jgi:hypothetical protein